MCDDQRVDHDPNAAIELPEDMGVRHDVACAREAARSVRVGVGAAAQRRSARVGRRDARRQVSSQTRVRGNLRPMYLMACSLAYTLFLPPTL